MPLDSYQPCPCGSGKKLKFCCSDIAHDIEKIQRMVTGDQPHAALRHVEQCLAKHPGRASLLDLKCMLELTIDEVGKAQTSVSEFVLAHPQSPTALALQAVITARSEQVEQSVAALQRAIELVDGEVPRRLREACGVVAQTLLVHGQVMAAVAHLYLQMILGPEDEDKVFELLGRLFDDGQLPLLLREKLPLRKSPAESPWKQQEREIERLAAIGRWQQAVNVLDGLGNTHGAQPALLYNRAVLGGWLGDDRAMIAGLHAYATMDVPLDDAVEAEATAQLLDRELAEETVDRVVCEYTISDMDALEERLRRDPRVDVFSEPLPETATDRRPRQSGVVFDRPAPESGLQLTAEEVPLVVGFLNLYSRRTDRTESLDWITEKTEDFEKHTGQLLEICGDALGPLVREDKIGAVSRTEVALSWRWSFPADTPDSVRSQIVQSERTRAIVTRWPDVPRAALGGKTPRQVAGDPQWQIPLLACVLILEQAGQNANAADAIARLRQELSLPQPEPIPATDGIGKVLPLARVPRLDLEDLTDEDLKVLYHRSSAAYATVALTLLARERLRRKDRPELAEIPEYDAYEKLIASTHSPQEAVSLIEEARQFARRHNETTSIWDVMELSLHLREGNIDEVERVLGVIEREHGDNQEVATAVYRMLYEAGLIPEDQPAGDLSREATSPAPQSIAPGDSSSTIWTPGDEPGSGKKKPAIWTPS